MDNTTDLLQLSKMGEREQNITEFEQRDSEAPFGLSDHDYCSTAEYLVS